MFENEGVVETMESEEAEEPSVAVSSDSALGVCPTCHDTFSQFFHQETEEWRYRNAIQVDGINYHPACHQDTIRVNSTNSAFSYISYNEELHSLLKQLWMQRCNINEGSARIECII